jgi:hypothetical protein
MPLFLNFKVTQYWLKLFSSFISTKRNEPLNKRDDRNFQWRRFIEFTVTMQEGES